jgi:hypothetical protein
MFENRAMEPVETVLRTGEEEWKKREQWRGESN